MSSHNPAESTLNYAAPADVLACLRAARELVARSWRQGSPGAPAPAGSVCASEAIHAATGRYSVIAGAHRALRAEIPALAAAPAVGVFHWNDDRERTQAEVVAAFDAAIATVAASIEGSTAP